MNDASQLDALRLFLARRDVACPRCCYNLRGSNSELCPECGARIELMVGSPDRRLGLWLTGLLAAGVPFGFNLVLALLASWGAYVSRNQPWARWQQHDWIVFGSLWGATVLAAIIMFVHMRKRPRFLCAPRRLQVMIAIALLALGAALQMSVLVVLKVY